MKLCLAFRPEAVEDVREARAWYESQLEGLGAEFARAVDAAISIVERNPEAFAPIDGTRR